MLSLGLTIPYAKAGTVCVLWPAPPNLGELNQSVCGGGGGGQYCLQPSVPAVRCPFQSSGRLPFPPSLVVSLYTCPLQYRGSTLCILYMLPLRHFGFRTLSALVTLYSLQHFLIRVCLSLPGSPLFHHVMVSNPSQDSKPEQSYYLHLFLPGTTMLFAFCRQKQCFVYFI